MDNEKKPFLNVLGWVAVAADIITLFQFIFSGNVSYFWTSQWVISLIFVVGLLGVGLGLLNMGGSHESAKGLMVIFGIIYLTTSLFLYLYLSYAQIVGFLSFGNFMGLGVLFLVAFSVGRMCFSVFDSKYLRWPSYGYGTANLLLIFALINKYVFNGFPIYWGIVGELVILLTGAGIFLSLYAQSEED